MLFSVLIAHYNNAKYLKTALESVLCQSYANWEVILVDDCSTDHFEEVIAEYKENDRIKVYINEKNAGCGYTKRKCVEKASGTILAFLDPDDSLHPEALYTMQQAHTLKPACSLIHSTHYICDESLTVKRVAAYPKPLPYNTPYLLLNDGSIHAFTSFKKDCYNRTAGISPLNKKAVDQDLYYKLEETGEVFFVNKPLYYYRIHTGSISNAGKEKEATLWHYQIIEEACQRRIKQLNGNNSQAKYWKKKYRTKYIKIRVFHSYKKKEWINFVKNLLIYPFIGGLPNLLSYVRKLPKEGMGLIKRSFVENYEIKA